MGLSKLLDNLTEYLDKGERKNRAHCDRIDLLLKKLSEKEERLKKKVEKEKNVSKRKKLKTELKIISVQRKKGLARRKELETKCL